MIDMPGRLLDLVAKLGAGSPLSYASNVSAGHVVAYMLTFIYRQTSNISGIKYQNLNVFRLVSQLSLSNPLKPGVENDAVGVAPTTSEWPTILLLTKVRLVLEVWR